MRAREFDRLGVPIISVVEGKDEGGFMRFVRAGMALPLGNLLAWARARTGPLPAARTGPRSLPAAGLAIVAGVMRLVH